LRYSDRRLCKPQQSLRLASCRHCTSPAPISSFSNRGCSSAKLGHTLVSMRILIVEDYELLRDSLAQGLREAGFAVDTASDGEQGWWHASSGSFDVMILDLMLPRMSGLSLLRRLRQQRNDVHVLVLTAKDTTEDRIEGLNLGADDYLVKPFAFGELLARVRAL